MTDAARVDLAIQSYRKPASLLYTLMTLKRHCGGHVDTVWIRDDCSNDGTVDAYTRPSVLEYFAPWRIRVRVNTVRTGWRHVRVPGSSYRSWWRDRAVVKAADDDVRYQWAITNTDKAHLFVCHDDVEFRGDIVGLYLSRAAPGTFVVGDLGQCWRCGNYREPHGLRIPGTTQVEARRASGGCTPARLLQGYRPPRWPRTPSTSEGRWVCRVNEWSALVDVRIAREIERRAGVLFGNYYDGADCAAFWFKTGVRLGYTFDDPRAPDVLWADDDPRQTYYAHAWQGHSGHSVWVDQGRGLAAYDADGIRRRMIEQFGVSLP
jgi:hypothetical protein